MKMKRLLPLSLLVLAGALNSEAQVANEGLANSIIAARQKNSQLMQQFSWNCRIEVMENTTVKDTRIEQCVYGANGSVQRTLLNDSPAALPHGFLRKRIAEKEREDTEKYLKKVMGLLDKYTLPTAGQVINFISTSPIPPPGPTGDLMLSGSSVVVPGDSMNLWVYAPTRATKKVTINTTDTDGNVINVTATYKTLANGLNYLQFATIDIPTKNLSLQVHNYDYINQNQ
jgi:hypothetical protein